MLCICACVCACMHACVCVCLFSYIMIYNSAVCMHSGGELSMNVCGTTNFQCHYNI